MFYGAKRSIKSLRTDIVYLESTIALLSKSTKKKRNCTILVGFPCMVQFTIVIHATFLFSILNGRQVFSVVM